MLNLIGKDLSGVAFHHDILALKGAACCLDLGDYRHSLEGKELKLLSGKKGSFISSFSTGRECIRLIQRNMGLPIFELISGENGPSWPEGIIGSISHSERSAIAIVVKEIKGMGIDIERRGRVGDKVVQRIATAEEIKKYASASHFDWTLLFSAKESVYKAINPLERVYFGFKDVELCFDDGKKMFSTKYVGTKLGLKVIDRLAGYWVEIEDQFLTLVILH